MRYIIQDLGDLGGGGAGRGKAFLPPPLIQNAGVQGSQLKYG